MVELMLDRGVIVRAMGDTIAFSPPLIITEAQVDTVADQFEAALDAALDRVGRLAA